MHFKYKLYHVKVLMTRFHLNGHTIGFDPQTQKLESPYVSQLHNWSGLWEWNGKAPPKRFNTFIQHCPTLFYSVR